MEQANIAPIVTPAAPHRKGQGKDNWRTPEEFFLYVQRRFNVTFEADCAASKENALCPLFCTEERSFFSTPDSFFIDRVCWLNPPFSQMKEFTDRVIHLTNKGATIFMLVPGSIETRFFHRMLENDKHVDGLVKGRISFVDPDTGKKASGNPVGSVLWVPKHLWSGSRSLRRSNKEAQ